DVRDDLDGAAEIVAAALLLDDGLVDLAGGVVAVAAEGGVGEALVVAEVEISFGTVIEDVDLTVLVGAHRAGIDVDVRVELLQPAARASVLQHNADRRTGEALAEGADPSAGNENMLGVSQRGSHERIFSAGSSVRQRRLRGFPKGYYTRSRSCRKDQD